MNAQRLSLVGLALLLQLPPLTAQQQPPASAPERWLVQFERRSFDLAAFRAANLRHDAAAVARIVGGLEAKVRRDQAPFVRAVTQLGGRVTDQFWIVNACAVELDPDKAGQLQQLAGVLRVDRDTWRAPQISEATNVVNHNSDALNRSGFKGAKVAVAILDTGADADMGGTGRPHRCYYEDGDLSKRNRLVVNRQMGAFTAEDMMGHGTAMAAIAAGGSWGSNRADHGHAPHADILSYCIADRFGGYTTDTTVVRAWQQVAADAVANNTVAANISYAGSPDPLNTAQQALDSVARNTDLLICAAAGNTGTLGTQFSQSCVNGIAVGAAYAQSHLMASLSTLGPVLGDTARFYPDLAACGADTVLPKVNDESSEIVRTGTSNAAPQVCGAAALLRSAVPGLTAIETKAILLASAVDISGKNQQAPHNTRNAYGVGLLRDDDAMALAQRSQDRGTISLSPTLSTWSRPLSCQQGKTYRAALAWMRGVVTSRNWANLDLEVLLGTRVVAWSRTPRNLYEVVQWTAQTTGTYTLRVRAVSFEQPSPTGTQDCAWATMEVRPPPVAGGFTRFGQGCARVAPGGITLPAAYQSTMGNIGNSMPFCTGASRYQQVFSDLDIPASTVLLQGLAARLDTPNPVGSTGSQQLQIRLGYSPYGPSTLTNNFSNNVLPGTSVLVYSGTIQLPAAGAFNTDPYKWDLSLRFTTPFLYQRAAGRNLIMEVDNSSPARVSMYFDAAGGSGVQAARLFRYPNSSNNYLAHNYGLVLRFLTSGVSMGQTPRIDVLGMPAIATTLRLHLQDAPPNAPAALLAGASNTRWGSTALPLDLSFIQAPGCRLLTSPDILLMTRTDARGSVLLPLLVPNNRAVIGMPAYAQFAIDHPATNALGMVFSDGAALSFGGRR